MPVWWSLGKRRRRKTQMGAQAGWAQRPRLPFITTRGHGAIPSPGPQITVTSEISFGLFLSFQVLLGSSAHMLLIFPSFQSSLLHFKSEGVLFIALSLKGRKLQRSAGLLIRNIDELGRGVSDASACAPAVTLISCLRQAPAPSRRTTEQLEQLLLERFLLSFQGRLLPQRRLFLVLSTAMQPSARLITDQQVAGRLVTHPGAESSVLGTVSSHCLLSFHVAENISGNGADRRP